MGELEAELALLREENARLKVERHRPADAGHVIERMRSIRPESSSEQRGGEVAGSALGVQAIAECLAMRDGLIEACQEVQLAMRGIRGRLGSLAGDIQDRAGDRAMSSGLAASSVETLDIELTVAADASPELAQSAA